ncbi:hypothetical protein J7E97_00975 [Streptomyces sp. ISL-66]|uniref:hypothetical protein n=1 Tax=Streptomyces sp. ISL-66 TaxID=2819186 RepID=UPI001BEB3A62|nr:hypothetical protein [Streptomyces sp. ISL-66]MBT2466469.1 hypothetical protein [Streptomyces sp. ISL-66]
MEEFNALPWGRDSEHSTLWSIAMNAKASCGPQSDPEFFAALDKLFAQYPEAADKYAIKCMTLELDILKIDFRKQVGVARIEDGRLITEYVDRDPARSADCCTFWHGECILECDPPWLGEPH